VNLPPPPLAELGPRSPPPCHSPLEAEAPRSLLRRKKNQMREGKGNGARDELVGEEEIITYMRVGPTTMVGRPGLSLDTGDCKSSIGPADPFEFKKFQICI